jgi:ketosteroid isomerase-like protein
VTPAEIAKRLVEEYDPEHPSEDMYADDFVSWHNYDENEIKLTRDQLAAGAKLEHGALGKVLTGFGYEDRKAYAAEDAVIVTHVLVGTLADGTKVRIPACQVCTLTEGRISRMDVYMDSAPMQVLGQAFAEAGVSLNFE